MAFWKLKRAPKPDAPEDRWSRLLAAIGGSATDLMLVTGPEDGGSVCTDWVGAVVSVSGADRRFPSLVDALEDGLFHPGCRHKLIVYRSEDGEAEAEFCTKIAVAGMTRRGEERGRMVMEATDAGEDAPRAQFMRWYDLARDKEKTITPELALHFCQEALGVLARRNVFGDDQPMIERVLKGRMQTVLRAHQRTNSAKAAVE